MPFRPTIFIFIIFAFISSACTSAKYLNMVPTGTMRHAPTHKALIVNDVQTTIKTGRSTPLEVETYEQALMASLLKTRMFSAVKKTPETNSYRLESTLHKQKLKLRDGIAYFDIAVRYRFVNSYNQVIYTTDIKSRCQKTPSDHMVGINRQRHAVECGVQKNLSTLVDKLYTAQHNFR